MRGIGQGDKGVMKMRNGYDVPGVAGQGACEEATLVVNEMDDDHFEDLGRNFGKIGWGCRRCLWRSTARNQSPDYD